MNELLKTRENIYKYFTNNSKCEDVFLVNEQRLSSYYNSMLLIQDTSLAVLNHREKGFSQQLHIEFWGLMQAIVIQQDSIQELHFAVTESKLDTKNILAWQKIRSFRNKCAGHPSKKDRPNSEPTTKVVFSGHINYTYFSYEEWTKDGVTHPTINLGELIDSYAIEANKKLIEIFNQLKQIG